MSTNRRLTVVPFAPSDYSLGEVLNQEHGYTTKDPAVIGAAFSLYFQWEGYRKSFLIQDDGSAVACTLDFDRDERQPSELRLATLGDIQTTKFSEFQAIKIRFEVFQVCYEFSANILAISETSAADGWTFIVGIPESISLYKLRRLPRLILDDQQREVLGSTEWYPNGRDGKSVSVTISEIGLSGVCCVAPESEIASNGLLKIKDDFFPMRVVRRVGARLVLATEHKDNQAFGSYFDHYREIAFPGLVPKSDCTIAQGIKLYRETNYFEKFASEQDAVTVIDEIEETWNALKVAQHETSADYYVVDSEGLPVGASSVAIAFITDSKPIWALHQLCAVTRPELLELTGHLYTWRAEYLAARSEPMDVVVWYDSKSRWIERIYTKFATQSRSNTELKSVAVKRVSIVSEGLGEYTHSKVSYGELSRVCVSAPRVMAGAGPKYLNASLLLDSVVTLGPSCTANDVAQIISALASHVSPLTSLEVTYPAEMGDSYLEGELVAGTDRLCRIPKEDLVNLVYSIRHSLAVTKKKAEVA